MSFHDDFQSMVDHDLLADDKTEHRFRDSGGLVHRAWRSQGTFFLRLACNQMTYAGGVKEALAKIVDKDPNATVTCFECLVPAGDDGDDGDDEEDLP